MKYSLHSLYYNLSLIILLASTEQKQIHKEDNLFEMHSLKMHLKVNFALLWHFDLEYSS